MTQASKQYILSCDWGTSSFRLRLVNLQDGRIAAEVISQDGIAGTFDRWKAQDKLPRLRFYREELKKQIKVLCSKVGFSLDGLPLIISGMASSSIGLLELPYASLPFPMSGKTAIIEKIDACEDFRHELLLISGLKNKADVMRGEETQMLGLMGRLPDDGETAGINEGSVFIFPGTHSKHIYLRHDHVTDFRTYMTGELFQLLANHSILKNAIESADWNESDLQGFRQGIRRAASSSLLASLFSVRTNQLFADLDKQQNFYYLSGLLIGTELKDLKKRRASRIVLCSSGNVHDLYKLALQESGLLDKTILVSTDLAQRAAVDGHLMVYRHCR